MKTRFKDDQHVQEIVTYMDKLQTSICHLCADPEAHSKREVIISYFIFSDDVRRMISSAKILYNTYEAKLYFMQLDAQYDHLMDRLKKVASNDASI